MKRIEIKLSLAVVAPLLDVIKEACDRAEKRLVVSLEDLDLDHDMKDVWQADLQSGQVLQFKTLLGLFDSEFFSTGTIVLDVTNAELILRACSAIRLLLRENNLKAFTDEILESGDVDLEAISVPEQKSFMGYLFLATLQELIIQHLDRAILGEEPPETESEDDGDDGDDDAPGKN